MENKQIAGLLQPETNTFIDWMLPFEDMIQGTKSYKLVNCQQMLAYFYGSHSFKRTINNYSYFQDEETQYPLAMNSPS